MTTDRAEIRRRALLAAAAVTLAAGCAGPEGGKPADAPGDDGLVTDSDPPAPQDTGDTAVADSARPADTDPRDSDVLDTATSKPDCVALALELAACCDALQAWCGDRLADTATAYDECVYGVGFSGSTGCIPWGPPVPPRARALA